MHKKSDKKHLSGSPVARPTPESLPGLKMLLLLLFVILPVVPVVVLLVSHLDRIIISTLRHQCHANPPGD